MMWVRLWADMPNDPKWRTIARVSKQKIGDVMAVFVHMMTNASQADELEIERIETIQRAMREMNLPFAGQALVYLND